MLYSLYVSVGLGMAASAPAVPMETYIGDFTTAAACRQEASHYAPDASSPNTVNTFKYRCVPGYR